MEKIQMTEEQAREIFEEASCLTNSKNHRDCPKHRDCIICRIDVLKEHGYIKKSELETLVEEAEEMYKNRKSFDEIDCEDCSIISYKLMNALQALKLRLKEYGGDR